MKFKIKHESRGRIRVQMVQSRMTLEQADLLEAWLQNLPGVDQAAVHERTCCAIITYKGERRDVLSALRDFSYEDESVKSLAGIRSSRAINRTYQEKLVWMVSFKALRTLFFPAPLRAAYTIVKSVPYMYRAARCLLRRQLHVEVLDGIVRGHFRVPAGFWHRGLCYVPAGAGRAAGGVDPQEIGGRSGPEHVAEHRPGVAQDAGRRGAGAPEPDPPRRPRSASGWAASSRWTAPLWTARSWSIRPPSPASPSPCPSGRAPPCTPAPWWRRASASCPCTQQSGDGRYDKIVSMIEQSEKLKSAAEDKAANLADKLVPYTLAGSALVYLLTRNVTRALSVLMVDFSCALKLSMPLAVLSAMREASACHATVKGGKYLEAMAAADTIVFDKTGTLTHATPVVARVIPFGGRDETEMLRLAACLEEHFPHSMANAVVKAARDRDLSHEEMHSEVEYLVAHGIASTVAGQRVIIGSAHFVFEDEHCTVPPEDQAVFDSLPERYSATCISPSAVCWRR